MSIAIAMYIAFLFLATWIPAHFKRRAVGYGLITDVSVHIVLQTMFGGDANGRAGLLLAGVLINATMHAYRKFAGYEKLTMDGWVRYAGQLTKPTDMPQAPAPKGRKPATKRKAPAKRKARTA